MCAEFWRPLPTICPTCDYHFGSFIDWQNHTSQCKGRPLSLSGEHYRDDAKRVTPEMMAQANYEAQKLIEMERQAAFVKMEHALNDRMKQGAMKADAGKPMVELLPFEALNSVGMVLKFGAEKYAAHNWRKGMAWSRLLGAALRHLFAWGRGEKLDQESGLPHLAHAACCVLFLLSYEQENIGEDDRWKEGN